MRQCQCKIKCLFLDFPPHGFFHGNNYDILCYILLLFFSLGFKSFAQVYSIQIFIFFSPASLNIVLILCDAQALRGEGGGGLTTQKP
jgi:hypothetical protein